eukprot:m.199973 g.199973  ORF g.199973 m.199973 type:complete len:87 (+) comp10661_c3_seq13:973-1233(+)
MPSIKSLMFVIYSTTPRNFDCLTPSLHAYEILPPCCECCLFLQLQPRHLVGGGTAIRVTWASLRQLLSCSVFACVRAHARSPMIGH